jgi:hypothetical protein
MVMEHKIHIYLEYLSVCPLVGMEPPTPSPAIECVIPPVTNGGDTHSPAGEGVGESQFGRLEKKPSPLSTLCDGGLYVCLCNTCAMTSC